MEPNRERNVIHFVGLWTLNDVVWELCLWVHALTHFSFECWARGPIDLWFFGHFTLIYSHDQSLSSLWNPKWIIINAFKKKFIHNMHVKADERAHAVQSRPHKYTSYLLSFFYLFPIIRSCYVVSLLLWRYSFVIMIHTSCARIIPTYSRHPSNHSIS